MALSHLGAGGLQQSRTQCKVHASRAQQFLVIAARGCPPDSISQCSQRGEGEASWSGRGKNRRYGGCMNNQKRPTFWRTGEGKTSNRRNLEWHNMAQQKCATVFEGLKPFF